MDLEEVFVSFILEATEDELDEALVLEGISPRELLSGGLRAIEGAFESISKRDLQSDAKME